MRLGDLDALKRAIEDRIDYVPSNDYDEGWNSAINTAIDEIDNAPAVEQRPTGNWSIDNRPSIGGLWKCSECNNHYPYKTKFCPNCGADMRGDTDEID